MQELIRASTFARLKRLAPRSVRRMIQHRGMPGTKRGETWYVEPAAATEWLAQNSPRVVAREKGPKVRAKSPRKRPPRERTPAEQAHSIDQHIVHLDHILAAFIGTLHDGQFDARAVTGIKQVSAELRMLERHRVDMQQRANQLVPKERHELVIARIARAVVEEIQASAPRLPETILATLAEAGVKINDRLMRQMTTHAEAHADALRTRIADAIEASDA